MSCGSNALAVVNDRVDVRCEIGLYRLRLVRADDAQPHRRGADAARRDEQERPLRVDESHVEQVEKCAKQRRVMACSPRRFESWRRNRPWETRVRRKSAARAPARGWRDCATGFDRNTSHNSSSSRDIVRAAVRRRHERQRAAPALRERLPRKRVHAGAVGDMPMLHRRLEPRRMREPARREPRVDQLPHQQIHVSNSLTGDQEIRRILFKKNSPDLLVSC